MFFNTRIIAGTLAVLTALVLLFVLRQANELLFLCLADSLGMLVACAIFVVTWHIRAYNKNSFAACLGLGYLFAAPFVFCHMLTLPGMGVFSANAALLHAPLRMAGTFMQAATLLGAPLLAGRRVASLRILYALGALAACSGAGAYAASLATQPANTLRPASYALVALLCVAGGLFHKKRKRIGADVVPVFIAAITALALSELAATGARTSGPIPPFLRIISFGCLYWAAIRAGVTKPYTLLFRNLKAREEELEKRKKNFEVLLEASPCAISLSDADGNLTYLSKQAYGLFGFDAADRVLGAPLVRWVEASHLAAFSNDLKSLLDAGANSTPPKEYLMQKANGERFWCSVTSAVLRSENRSPVGFISVMQNTTQRKNREEALHKSEAQLRQAQSIAMIGSFEYQFNSGAAHWSLELFRLFGLPPGSFPASLEAFQARIHAEDWEKFTALLAANKERNQSFDLEVRYRRTEKEPGYARVMGSLYRNSKGEAQKLVGTFQDISDKKALEALKEDVDRMMHHDLRTPLTALTGLPHLLENDANLTDEQRTIVADIIAAGQRALNQVNLFRDLYQIENGTYAFQPAPVDIPAILRQIAEDMRPKLLAQQSSLRILVNNRPVGPADALKAAANELLCFSMLSNLIDNALDATPRGQPVSISLQDGAAITIDIHNQGQVPPEIRARFFEKYATWGKAKGTGLGTYSARLMAMAQHGDIRMQSSAEHGTTLRVTLPKAVE